MRDDAPGSGRWQVAGAHRSAGNPVPGARSVSQSDRIVPAATAAGLGRQSLGQGHVGMIVGGRARTALWRPLASLAVAGSGRAVRLATAQRSAGPSSQSLSVRAGLDRPFGAAVDELVDIGIAGIVDPVARAAAR